MGKPPAPLAAISTSTAIGCTSTRTSMAARSSQRAVNLAGATAVTVSFTYEDDNLGTGQSVIVEAWNVVTSAWQTLTGGTLGSTTGNGNGTFNATLSASQIGAASAIRFRTDRRRQQLGQWRQLLRRQLHPERHASRT